MLLAGENTIPGIEPVSYGERLASIPCSDNPAIREQVEDNLAAHQVDERQYAYCINIGPRDADDLENDFILSKIFSGDIYCSELLPNERESLGCRNENDFIIIDHDRPRWVDTGIFSSGLDVSELTQVRVSMFWMDRRGYIDGQCFHEFRYPRTEEYQECRTNELDRLGGWKNMQFRTIGQFIYDDLSPDTLGLFDTVEQGAYVFSINGTRYTVPAEEQYRITGFGIERWGCYTRDFICNRESNQHGYGVELVTYAESLDPEALGNNCYSGDPGYEILYTDASWLRPLVREESDSDCSGCSPNANNDRSDDVGTEASGCIAVGMPVQSNWLSRLLEL